MNPPKNKVQNKVKNKASNKARNKVRKLSYNTFNYNLQLKRPLLTGSGQILQRNCLGVEISHKNVPGLGVTAPIEPQNFLRLKSEADKWLSTNISRNISLEDLLQKIEQAPIPSQFLIGIDIALRDLLSKKLARPFSFAIDPMRTPTPHLPIRGLLDSPQDLEAELPQILGSGYQALKLKVGVVDLDEDIARLKTIRNLAGDIALSLDANGAYDNDTALTALEAFADYGIEYIEEPVHGLKELVELSTKSPIPIAVDESCQSFHNLEQVTGADSISVVVIKPECFANLKTLYWYAQNLIHLGKKVVVSTSINGAVGLACAAHFASILENAETTFVGLDTSKLIAYDPLVPPTVLNGYLYTPNGHGLF